MNDIWLSGMVAFGALIIAANVKICLFSKTYSLLSIIFLVGSVLLYPITYWTTSQLEIANVYGYYEATMRQLSISLTLLAITGIVGISDLAVTKYLGWDTALYFPLWNGPRLQPDEDG